jgi:hypothetical protein
LAALTGCATTLDTQKVLGQKILGPQLMGVLGVKNSNVQGMANSHYPTEPPGTPQIQRFDPLTLNHGAPISVGYFLGSSEREWPSTGAVRMMPPREGVADLPTLSGVRNMRVGRTIRCTYGIDGNHRTVYLWDKVRPVIDAGIPRENLNRWAAERRVTADIAVTVCPAKWGDALTLIWGQNAWQTLQASAGASSSRLQFESDIAKAVADRERDKIIQAARDAAFEKLSDREKCMRRNGLEEPEELRQRGRRVSVLYSSQVDIACGRYK